MTVEGGAGSGPNATAIMIRAAVKIVPETTAAKTIVTALETKDIWIEQDDPHHPGAIAFRKAIRRAVKEFEGEEYSRSVFKYIVRKKLRGYTFYTGKKENRLTVIDSNCELKELIHDFYEEERNRRQAARDTSTRGGGKRSGKAKRERRRLSSERDAKKHNIDIELGEAPRQQKLRSCDAVESIENGEEECHNQSRSSGKPRGRASSTRERKNQRKDRSKQRGGMGKASEIRRRKPIDDPLDDAEKGTSSVAGRIIYYLSDEAFRKLVRGTALELKKAPYSRVVFKHIKRQLKEIIVYASPQEENEATKTEVKEAVYEIYEEERYMLSAHSRDVYFDVEHHSGTRFWRKVVRLVVAKNRTVDFDKKIDREIKKQLQGVSYFVGRPPVCEIATKSDMIERFDQQFYLEKGQQAQKTPEIQRSQRPPIPGNLYWRLLGQKISSPYRNWEWFHTKSAQCKQYLARQPLVVKCSSCCSSYCSPCYIQAKRALQPCYCRTMGFFRTDPETGEDVFQRIAKHLEITMFGHTTAWPMLALIGVAFAGMIFLIIFSVLKKLVFVLL
jgi:hypothetical protein